MPPRPFFIPHEPLLAYLVDPRFTPKTVQSAVEIGFFFSFLTRPRLHLDQHARLRHLYARSRRKSLRLPRSQAFLELNTLSLPTQRFRKLPASQTGISTLATNFFALLTTPDSPPAAYVRSAFVPALLNSTIKPRSSDEVQALDERIRTLFETPPAVVVAQGIINAEQIANAWKLGASAPIADSVFVVFALHQELESVRAEVDREQEANLSSELDCDLEPTPTRN